MNDELITVKVSDGKSEHVVHTKGEAKHLIERYFPEKVVSHGNKKTNSKEIRK